MKFHYTDAKGVDQGVVAEEMIVMESGALLFRTPPKSLYFTVHDIKTILVVAPGQWIDAWPEAE